MTWRRRKQRTIISSVCPCSSFERSRSGGTTGSASSSSASVKAGWRSMRSGVLRLGRETMSMTLKPPMLTGYRVLDITQFVAGPTCTRILAELGADVIKIELAPHGDRSRIQGIKPRDQKGSSQSTYFFQHNHSKRSLALQWKHPRSTEILKALIAKADVLVENFAPGVMARAGLGYDECTSSIPNWSCVRSRLPASRTSERPAGLRLHCRCLRRHHRPDRRGEWKPCAIHDRYWRCLNRGGSGDGGWLCSAAS